ncbi:MAG TPA: fused MFS/spermidine synthase [Methylomirabilota bacterium]
MLILFGLTIFVGASLLFLVQPMFARMALPLLGGAPAVWNTAMVFYQAVLLAGYAYAHFSTRWLGPRRQAGLHLLVLVLPLVALPIALPHGWTPPGNASPIPWLLALLTVAVGLPFFAVSATSPVVQAWFAATGLPAARDPYVLYAASNLGSMLALLSYPVLVERLLRLDSQSRLWAWSYGVFVALAAACAVALWRAATARRAEAPGQETAPAPAADAGPDGMGRPITPARRARWVVLAAVPSSLMLSVTTYLSTDIAAIPLLWVVPLAIYLLTFTLVFGRRRIVPHRVWVEILPVALLPLVLILVARANEPLALVIPTHLVVFFIAAMVCHGELVGDRPDPRHLTEFYLWISVGGVTGGAFTALLAPVVFTNVLEYPLVLAILPLLPARPAAAWQGRVRQVLDILLPLGLGAVTVALIVGLERAGLGGVWIGPAIGLVTLLCLAFWRRPVRFALGLAALLLAGSVYRGEEGQLLYAERSFFGVSRVTRDPSGQYHMLMHGTTLHGMQGLAPARRREPLTYFHPNGPLGQFFAAVDGPVPRRAVAVVGLGAGSLACYGKPEQRWTFYEIDPTVLRIAGNTAFFTFLRDCPPKPFVILGDARLTLVHAPDAAYDLIILDAYSSDAPPMHLITLDAVRLYLTKLAPGGVLLFNISNRHLVLEPVLGVIARAAGLVARTRDDVHVDDAERRTGRVESQWVAMARREEDLGALRSNALWKAPTAPPGAQPWTDNFASLLTAFRWVPRP